MSISEYHRKITNMTLHYSEEYDCYVAVDGSGKAEFAFSKGAVNESLLSLFQSAPYLYRTISNASNLLQNVKNLIENGAHPADVGKALDLIDVFLTDTLLYPQLGVKEAAALHSKFHKGKFKNG